MTIQSNTQLLPGKILTGGGYAHLLTQVETGEELGVLLKEEYTQNLPLPEAQRMANPGFCGGLKLRSHRFVCRNVPDEAAYETYRHHENFVAWVSALA